MIYNRKDIIIFFPIDSVFNNIFTSCSRKEERCILSAWESIFCWSMTSKLYISTLNKAPRNPMRGEVRAVLYNHISHIIIIFSRFHQNLSNDICIQ